MKYQKPEVVQVGPAIGAIQAALIKNDQVTDSSSTLPSDDSYQSDE